MVPPMRMPQLPERTLECLDAALYRGPRRLTQVTQAIDLFPLGPLASNRRNADCRQAEQKYEAHAGLSHSFTPAHSRSLMTLAGNVPHPIPTG